MCRARFNPNMQFKTPRGPEMWPQHEKTPKADETTFSVFTSSAISAVQ